MTQETTNERELPAIIRILAEWEDRNGSLCAALYDEWIALYPAITKAAVAQSPRMIREEWSRVASACASAAPVAWVVHTPNGNVRLWSHDQHEANRCADANGLTVTPLYASPAAPAEAIGRLTNAQVRSLMQIAHTWSGPDENDSRSDDLEMALRAVRVAAPAEVPQTKPNDHLAANGGQDGQGLDSGGQPG
jgi:hypothetical protein